MAPSMVRKAGTRRKPTKETTAMQIKQIQPLFGELEEGASLIRVDPRCCVPLTKIRHVSPSGLDRLEHSFTCGASNAIVEGGLSAAGNKAVVVKLDGAFYSYPRSYLIEERGMSIEESKKELAKFPAWFGIVDGLHRLLVIQRLMKKIPEQWAGFSWTVLCIRASPLDQLRAYARARNSLQEESYIIKTTVFDMMKSLYEDSNTLKRDKCLEGDKLPKGFVSEVADFYAGGPGRSTSTQRQLAGCVLKLSRDVIEKIGELVNGEHPELTRSYEKQRASTQGRSLNPFPSLDCRIYRDMISTNTLKGASTFMNSSEEDQINSLYRAQMYCKQNNFRTIPAAVMQKLAVAAKAARHEAEKFQGFLESDSWPKDMEVVKKNLLRTSVLDEEVLSNSGNDVDILPSLLNVYQSSFPSQFKWKMKKYTDKCGRDQQRHDVPQQKFKSGNLPSSSEATTQPYASENSEEKETGCKKQSIVNQDRNEGPLPLESNGLEQPNKDPETQCTHRDGRNDRLKKYSSNEPIENEDEREKISRELSSADPTSQPLTQTSERLDTGDAAEKNDGISVLRSQNISCYQMSWQHYRNTVVSEENKFDLVLTDPPYMLKPNSSNTGANYTDYIDDAEMEAFVQFTRRMVKPGGYAVIFSSFHLLPRWFNAFRTTDMCVMQHPLTFVKESSGLQRTRNNTFPQNAVDFALVGRCSGQHPSGFKANLQSQYCLLRSSHKRKFNVIDNIPIVRNKLTYPSSRARVRVEEKNPFLLAEIMTTFAPEGGNVLDTYAGTMTTGIACLATRRSCTLVEQSRDCFILARDRLMRCAKDMRNTSQTSRNTRSRSMGIGELQSETKSFLSWFGSSSCSPDTDALDDEHSEENDNTEWRLRKGIRTDRLDSRNLSRLRAKGLDPKRVSESLDDREQCEAPKTSQCSPSVPRKSVVCASREFCILADNADAQRPERLLSVCTKCSKKVHDLCSGGETDQRICAVCSQEKSETD